MRLSSLSGLIVVIIALSMFACESGSNSGNSNDGMSPSGYRYTHHIKNDGKKPEVGSEITYHNVVFLNDTTLVQSTFTGGKPWKAVLPDPDSIPKPPRPDYEAFFLMSPGDSMTIYQTLDTFPPDRLPRGVKPSDVFSYNLKLISIKSKEEVEQEKATLLARLETVKDSLKVAIEDFHHDGFDDGVLQTTESGLQYIVNREGTGPKVKDGGFARVHYIGMLHSGDVFDESFSKLQPRAFRIGRGRVIPGWDEGIPLMNVGGEYTFFVPYQLAYGVAGNPPRIPEKANLVFFVSLVETY